MITNTELEYKGNLYPNQIVNFLQDVDKLSSTSNYGTSQQHAAI